MDNKKQRILTGITTTGEPHLGNYVGAIRPAVESSQRDDVVTFFFLADYHALVKNHDAEKLHTSTLALTAAWLACGLDIKRAIFYRQSDIPEIMELNWLLTCFTAKGLMNRSHAYKALVAENTQSKTKDPDRGITMGLFCYPILMTADILMFKANRVPVGRDQLQHVEMARDIAMRFNHHYGEEYFVLPEAEINDDVAILTGLDGRKMSKSHNNTIPLFASRDQLHKLIKRVRTNSLPPSAPKDPEDCPLFDLYKAFTSKEAQTNMRNRYAEGIAWSEMKEIVFELIDSIVSPYRQDYQELLNDPTYIESVLQQGAELARQTSVPFMQRLRSAIGIKTLAR